MSQTSEIRAWLNTQLLTGTWVREEEHLLSKDKHNPICLLNQFGDRVLRAYYKMELGPTYRVTLCIDDFNIWKEGSAISPNLHPTHFKTQKFYTAESATNYVRMITSTRDDL